LKKQESGYEKRHYHNHFCRGKGRMTFKRALKGPESPQEARGRRGKYSLSPRGEVWGPWRHMEGRGRAAIVIITTLKGKGS